MTFTRHPVDNPVITQPWGANRTGGVTPDPNGTAIQQLVFNYGNYQEHGHDGIDYGCPIGTPVYAPGPGVIEWSGWGQDMPQHLAIKYGFVYGPGGWPSGILVCMAMDDGRHGCYVAHLSQSYYETGRRVAAGTLIGLSGNTGRSGGPHVHFSAIRFPVNYSDPLYSRVNPLPLFTTVTHVPIRPGATGDPATQEDTLSAAEVEQIVKRVNAYTGALLVSGYTVGSDKHPGGNMVAEVNQREQRDTNAIVKNLVGAIAALSKGEKFDEAKLLAGVQESARIGSLEGTKQAIESIDTQTTVTIKDQP